jgi:protein TonB
VGAQTRLRWLAGCGLLVIATSLVLGFSSSWQAQAASASSRKPRPTPGPSATPPPTVKPTPSPTRTPPAPSPSHIPPAPSASAAPTPGPRSTVKASLPVVPQEPITSAPPLVAEAPAGALPDTGPADSSAGTGNDTQRQAIAVGQNTGFDSTLLLIMVAVLSVPLLLVMAVVATVLTRR